MAKRDLSKVADKDVIVHAFCRLGFGAIPIENWGCFFAPGIMVYPHDEALANRAFSIWFPTILDFIDGESEMKRVCDEAKRRNISIDRIGELAEKLGAKLRAVARMLSREEQIFLRDQRLQNVHGSLEYFLAAVPSVKWYDAAKDIIVVEQIPEEVLHYSILKPFNADKHASKATLRTRVTSSAEWIDVFDLWRTELTGKHLAALSKFHGISS